VVASGPSNAPGTGGRSSSGVGITFYGCGPDEAAWFREAAPRYEVVPTITDAALSEATIHLCTGNRCVSVGHKSEISGSVLLALRRNGVRYISTRSAGYNHIDLQSAEAMNICVENVEYSPDSVADFTLMLILMVIRNVKTTIGRVQANDYRLPDQRGRELRDMTIGVVGTGRIGSAVIERLRGFGGRVLAYDRCPKMTEATYVSLEVLLQESDVVTLHTPLTGGTHHLLNRERIDQIRPGGFVVNTGRGSLIDTEALLCALGRGRLGGAALDVVEGEEGLFYFDHSQSQMEGSVLQGLQRLPNVLITPHTAYYTDHALNDVVENTLVNCLQFLENERNG
jgi:D-specific alpha-keto acid dehydrogenase